MLEQIHNIVKEGFSGKNIIVIGDVMLDEYLIGDISRISPEAPVPVVHLKHEKQTLGGAGNVALNLRGLDISVDLISAVGNDLPGEIIKSTLAENDLSSKHIFTSSRKPTITKTRIVGGNQQMLRLDKENIETVTAPLEAKLKESFIEIIHNKKVDAVIVSDYAKGTVSDDFCRAIIQKSNEMNIPVFVDPKGKSFEKYKGSSYLIPNEEELSLVAAKKFESRQALEKTAKKLQKQCEVKHLVITRGEQGMLHICGDGVRNIPARAQEVFDVSGAGDTVIALAAASLTAGLSATETLELANMAAGYVVSKFGTHPISHSELQQVVDNHLSEDQQLFDIPENGNHLSKGHGNKEKTIVFTNGCFDIIHAGHVHLLKKAKQQGDTLIVAINTDHSVRKLKGEGRPVNSLEDRIRVLEAISYVDKVVPFDEPTPLELIKKITPDVLVKGADYEESEIAGAGEVKAAGGKVIRIPLVEGKSTSSMLKQVSVTDE